MEVGANQPLIGMGWRRALISQTIIYWNGTEVGVNQPDEHLLE